LDRRIGVHELAGGAPRPRQADVVVREVLERAVAVALRDPRRVEPRAGDRGASADARMRLLAPVRGLDDPAHAPAETAGLGPERLALDLHRCAQFSGSPASMSTRRRRGPSRYRFRSARLASQAGATSPRYLA